MAYGRPANVRSHRRRGTRRRRRFAPWISATLVGLVVVAGIAFGYQQLLARTCSGQQSARIVASPSTANLLSGFATGWARTEPATEDGTCTSVSIQSADSAEVATKLAAGWDVAAEDPPDVWVPASTAWAQKAAASDVAEPLIPDLRPSIARTPTVIAMPEPMAAVLDWPDTQLQPDADVRWESLLEEFADDQQGWARFDHPEWGAFRFGMSNPARDTAGLLSLSAILDSDENGATSREELSDAFTLHRLLDPQVYHETTEQLLAGLAEVAEQGDPEQTLQHVSAFPALEQDVLAYNQSGPEVPLAAIYPSNGNIEADHPYLVLNAEWMTDAKRAVADEFLAYVRSADPQQQLREAGFRGTRNREPGAAMVEQNGLQPELVALPRALLVPEAVALTIDQWTALTRPSNVLIAFDVSGSMLQEVPGAGEPRMELAADAATETAQLFTDDDQVGLWEFSTALDGDLDYRSLVSLGALGDQLEDGRSRRQQLLDAVDNLVPRADTGLYNTIQAAYDTLLGSYDPDATNMVVVITDGENDTGDRSTISLDDLLTHLGEASGEGEQVRVVTVSFGEEPDFEIMRQISEATGSAAYRSQDGFDLSEVLRTAVFSNTPG
ncbi:MAG: VWA domain-containing protein [Micromonosporaceae bacterium]|nr:VWA domain-containing protein [Micromonosporaceae bacterium]